MMLNLILVRFNFLDYGYGILRGLTHQGSESFSSLSRGNQCMCNCLAFFSTYLQMSTIGLHINNWTPHILHSILHTGDKIYNEVIAEGKCAPGPLLISDLPETLFCQSHLYKLSVIESYTGSMAYLSTNIDGLHNLDQAVEHSFRYSPFSMFLAHGSPIALLQYERFFFLFDSHSRSQYGLQCPDGKCCILRFESLSYYFPF